MAQPNIAALSARLDALEQKAFGHARRRLTKRQLAELEGISTREVMRRVARGVYAKPEIENGRCYFWSDGYRCKSVTGDTAKARAARDPRLRARHAAAESPKHNISQRGAAR
jgi:hypothetical protein